MICPACVGETFSRDDRMKPATCDDCLADHSIVGDMDMTSCCDCAIVGHDKSKLKKPNDLPESILNEIDELVGKEINKDRSSDAKV